MQIADKYATMLTQESTIETVQMVLLFYYGDAPLATLCDQVNAKL